MYKVKIKYENGFKNFLAKRVEGTFNWKKRKVSIEVEEKEENCDTKYDYRNLMVYSVSVYLEDDTCLKYEIHRNLYEDVKDVIVSSDINKAFDIFIDEISVLKNFN